MRTFIKPFKPNSFQLLTGCITLISLGGWLEMPDDFVAKYPASHYFDIELESYPGEYRVVFWFDN